MGTTKLDEQQLPSGSGTVEIVDNLTSDAVDKALSAKQGKVLDDSKLSKETSTNERKRVYAISATGGQEVLNGAA